MRLLILIRNTLLNILGDIKLFKYPFFMVYDPKSYRFKGNDFNQVLDVIQEGDVLLRRFDGYLNTYFIPGYWNHAGIYIGGKEHKIIHAVSEGVIIETIFDFCKTDHLIILRPNFKIDPVEFSKKIESVLAKRTQYDFAFNFEDETDLSCSELVWFMYKNYEHGMVLEETKFLKVKVLPPDSIIKGNFTEVLKVIKQ